MIQEALTLALEFIENSECGTADLEARIKEALREHAMREVQRLGQEIEQEPVAWINVEKRRLEFAEPMVWHTPTVVKLERIPLYTHQRTWVGLTAGEILDTLISVDEKTVRLPSLLGQFACAIEAKLKEKNA